MVSSTYSQLKVHTSRLHAITWNLEASIDLAEQLGAFKLADLDDDAIAHLVNTDDEIEQATAENAQRMLDHLDILAGIVAQAREDTLTVVHNLGLEIRFAQSARARAAQRCAGKGNE